MYPAPKNPIQKHPPTLFPNTNKIIQRLLSRWNRNKQTPEKPITASIAPLRCSQPLPKTTLPVQNTMPSSTRRRLSPLENRNMALNTPRSQRPFQFPPMLSPVWPFRYRLRKSSTLKGSNTIETRISPAVVEVVYEQSREYELPTLLVTKPDGCICAVKIIKQRTDWKSVVDAMIEFDTSDDDDTEGEDEDLLYDTDSSDDDEDFATEFDDEDNEGYKKRLYRLRRTKSRRNSI